MSWVWAGADPSALTLAPYAGLKAQHGAVSAKRQQTPEGWLPGALGGQLLGGGSRTLTKSPKLLLATEQRATTLQGTIDFEVNYGMSAATAMAQQVEVPFPELTPCDLLNVDTILRESGAPRLRLGVLEI